MLLGRKAVITGATQGIGRAIANEFERHGAIVAGVDINESKYTCDVSDFEAVKNICEQIVNDLGGIDILVNNAGITRDNLLLRMTETEFDAVLNVNLKGAFNFAKHLSRALLKSKNGRIINISSVSGLTGNAGQVNYSASKAGLVGMTKTLAKEFAGKGITVNAIAPGFIETDMTAVLPESIIESMHKAIPLKRFGQVQDIANLAAFLASDNASYITGEVIRVDGGMCI